MEELGDLVKQAQTGDLAAFSTVVRRFQDMAVGYAYSQLSDFHLAEDVAQEVFIGAYLSLPKLQHPSAFPGWFRRVILTQCNRHTRRKHLPTVEWGKALETVSNEKRPDEWVEEKDLKDQILAAVRDLPEPERAVITLFYISELSQKEIAFEFHGISFKTRPESMIYRYRLTGYDNDWKNTHAKRVEYQNLPVGNYTFMVLAVDRDLVYSEKPAAVSLEFYYQPMSSSVWITELKVQNVFASFYKTYSEQAIGSAHVINDDPNPVEATLGFYIPDLMRRPTEQKVQLEPHSSQRISLNAILDEEILDIEGAIPVQAEVSLSCAVGEQMISIEESRSVTVYGRGALTWDQASPKTASSVSALTRADMSNEMGDSGFLWR